VKSLRHPSAKREAYLPADRFFGQTPTTYISLLIPILRIILPHYPIRSSIGGSRIKTIMVSLHMGVWAGIAAGGVMVMLVLLPILGCMFSRNKKAKKVAELEESAVEKGEVIYSAPALAQTPAPTRPVNAILQKPAMHVSKHEIRTQSSTQSMSPSYQSQSSTLAPASPLRNSTPSPPLQPHMQPMWTKPSP
jgi:hypothetical protein